MLAIVVRATVCPRFANAPECGGSPNFDSRRPYGRRALKSRLRLLAVPDFGRHCHRISSLSISDRGYMIPNVRFNVATPTVTDPLATLKSESQTLNMLEVGLGIVFSFGER